MTQSRVLHIDVLRVWAAWLRCFLHTLVPFMVFKTGMWPIKYDNTSNLLPDFFVLTIHSCIMEVFFIIAGFVMMSTIDAKGLKIYISSRIRKIFIPFGVGILTLIPYILLLFQISDDMTTTGVQWQWSTWMRDGWYLWYDNLFVLGHLWFLYYLLIYYIIVLGLIYFFPKLHTTIKSIPPLVFKGLLPLLLLCLYMGPKWYVENPLTTHIEWPSFAYYFFFFGLGIYVRYHFCTIAIETFKISTWTISFVLLSLVNGWLQTYYLHPLPEWQTIIRCTAHLVSLAQTCAGIILLTRLAVKYQHVALQSWFKPHIEAAYWTYLVHAPMVMTCHLLLYPINMPDVLKFIVAFSVSIYLATASYRWIGKKLLN